MNDSSARSCSNTSCSFSAATQAGSSDPILDQPLLDFYRGYQVREGANEPRVTVPLNDNIDFEGGVVTWIDNLAGERPYGNDLDPTLNLDILEVSFRNLARWKIIETPQRLETVHRIIGFQRRLAESVLARTQFKEMVRRRLLHAQESARQDAVVVLPQQAVVALEVFGDAVAQGEDDTAAAAQVRFEAADVAGAELADVAEENAVIRSEVAVIVGVGAGELMHAAAAMTATAAAMFAASGAHFFARELTVIVRIEPCERTGASRVEFRPRQYAIGI